jgi:hypothetical protein
MKKAPIFVLAVLASYFSHAQEMPSGYWQVVNLPVVYHIEADGTFTQKGTESLDAMVTGKLVFEDADHFEVIMRNHGFVEKGYLKDGKMYLLNKNQSMDIWLPELELKHVSESEADDIATVFSALSGETSDRFERLREKRSRKYLNMIKEDDIEGVVANAYYVLVDREQPIAKAEALQDLENESPYISLAAALYLAHFESKAAIPYLIVALDRKEIRSKDRVLRALIGLTNVDKGTEYETWDEWWRNEGISE